MMLHALSTLRRRQSVLSRTAAAVLGADACSGGWRSLAAAAAMMEYPPHNILTMPSLSPTMDKGNLSAWKKEEGDALSVGQVLCEIETDKATLDMDIMDDGFLAKILRPEGSKDVLVGDPIAVVVAEASDVGAFKDFTVDSVGGGGDAAAAAPSPSPSPPPTPPPSSSPPPKRDDSSKAPPSSVEGEVPRSRRRYKDPGTGWTLTEFY